MVSEAQYNANDKQKELIARLRRERDEMRGACQATLLFHSPTHWGKVKQESWTRLTGKEEATTKVLCNTVRAALAPKPKAVISPELAEAAERNPETATALSNVIDAANRALASKDEPECGTCDGDGALTATCDQGGPVKFPCPECGGGG